MKDRTNDEIKLITKLIRLTLNEELIWKKESVDHFYSYYKHFRFQCYKNKTGVHLEVDSYSNTRIRVNRHYCFRQLYCLDDLYRSIDPNEEKDIDNLFIILLED